MLQMFQKHKELIRRPTISKELQSERETLLARLLDYNKGLLFCPCEFCKHDLLCTSCRSSSFTTLTFFSFYLGLKTDFENRCHGSPGDKSGPLIGRNLPEVVNKIVWVRQLIHKVSVCVC